MVLTSGVSLFHGWSVITWVLAFMGASGGILVALSVKHSDSILKTFATSGAIVLCAILGYQWLGSPLTIETIIGACCAVLALFNYNDEGQAAITTTGR